MPDGLSSPSRSSPPVLRQSQRWLRPLAGSLSKTLRQLETEFAPNLILVEPSGVADPRHLLSAVEQCQGRTLKSRFRVALLDPLRMIGLMAVVAPLVSSTMAHADLIMRYVVNSGHQLFRLPSVVHRIDSQRPPGTDNRVFPDVSAGCRKALCIL
jgi:hypothetical protein